VSAGTQWLPAVDERARIVTATGTVYEGVCYGTLHYPRNGWSITLVTDAGESVGIDDRDVRDGRKRLEPAE
jgi:hypothetical protein